VSCDKDPLRLAVGDSFTLQVKCGAYEDLFEPFGGKAVVAEGSFKLEAAVNPDGFAFASGSLSSTNTSPTNLDLKPVGIKVTPSADGQSFALQFGRRAQARILKPVYLKAQASQSADVFKEGTPLRVLATDALDKLADGLNDPATIDEVRKKLFDPTAGTAATSGGVTATLDWVLFHRRRFKDCGVAPTEPPEPPPVKTVKHLVQFVEGKFVRRVESLLERNLLDRALSATEEPVFSQRLGEAEFEEGKSVLHSDPADLQTAWSGFTQDTPRQVIVVAETTPTIVKQQAQAIAKACGSARVNVMAHAIAPPAGYAAVTFVAPTPLD
jgi:hypothetical protein